MDKNLTEEDLSHLFRKYYKYRAQWCTIGCRLGISQNDLDVIDQDNRGKSAKCFMEVLTLWLKAEGKKKESELDRAVKEVKKSTTHNSGVLLYLIVTIGIAVAIISISTIRPATVPESDTVNLTATVTQLKKGYKHQSAVEFKLLDHANDMPFINVTMKSNGFMTESVQLFHDIDKKYQNVMDTELRHNGPRVLITGSPGAGKTTLLRQLAKEWAEGRSLQSCQILFLVHLDNLSKKNKPQSLNDLLELTPHNDLKNIKKVSEEIRDNSGAGTCFLLDSYDGLSWKNDYVHSLFFGKSLHLSLCVLTSRTLKSDNDIDSVSQIHNVNIVGFNSSHLERYLHNLSNDRDVIKSILTLWENNESTKEMCVLPLHMVMLLYIANHGGNLSVQTRTQVYIAFMNVTLKHFADHHIDWNTVSLKQCIVNNDQSDELCVAFHHMAHVAYQMYVNKIDKFPEHPNVVRNINKLGFVNVAKIKSTDDQVKYTFFHPTFIEYYAAIHLLNLPTEQWFYLYVKFDSQHFHVIPSIWLFFFGLLGEHYGGSSTTVPQAMKLLNSYYSDQGETIPPMIRQPGCIYNILTYVREINWTKKNLNTLLESSGLLVNYSMCVEDISSESELSGLLYLLNHASINTFKFGPYYRNLLFQNRGASFDAHDFDPLIACFNTSGEMTTSLKLPKITHTHFDVWDSYEGLSILDCLLKAAVNLHTLHVGLEGLGFKDMHKAVMSIVKRSTKKLQVLSLNIELHCQQLPALVNNLNQLSSELKLIKLKVTLSQLCLKTTAPPLDKLMHPENIEKLELIISESISVQQVVNVRKLTGLKCFSVSLNRKSSSNDIDLLGQLSALKNLVFKTTNSEDQQLNS